jgi:DNA-binding transcriptional LysR family regulator
MDKDQFDGILAFKIVAEKRSFTAAAEEMRVSAPAVSKMISLLEKKMKVTLLTRTTRTVNLTEAGKLFLENAGPAIEQIINAQELAQSQAKKPSGTLKLNIPGIFYPVYLAPHLSSFLQKYPDISLDIYSSDEAIDVFQSGFDAGIRTSDIVAHDMVAVKLFGPIQWVVAGSPKYLNKFGRPKHPKELLTHNCIKARFGINSGIYDKWEFQEKGKEFEVKIHGNLIFNDTLQIRQAVLDGHGLTYNAYEVVKDHVQSGKLEIILSNFQTQTEGFYIYFPKVSQVSPKLRAFIDHFKQINVSDKKRNKF